MSNDNNDMPQPTKPLKEHAFLEKFLGHWEITAKMFMPDGSTLESSGFQKCEKLGDLWVVGWQESDMGDGTPMKVVLGWGFDVTKKKYVGFYVASPSSALWTYEGDVSADGRSIVLMSEGPNMMGDEPPTAWYRDTTTFHDDGTATFTGEAEISPGRWEKMMEFQMKKKE